MTKRQGSSHTYLKCRNLRLFHCTMEKESKDIQLCVETTKRGAHLLKSGQWTDCSFSVGTAPHQVIMDGHKLILAMTSPVFEAMLYGAIAEKNYPINIVDINPAAFKALLDYIYTGSLNMGSIDEAIAIFYAAKKYMLQNLMKECIQYLHKHIDPSNVCQIYEFTKLFGLKALMEKCVSMICTKTKQIISESSFEEAEPNTVITIYSQDNLNIDSELDLVEALERCIKSENEEDSTESSPEPATNTQNIDDSAEQEEFSALDKFVTKDKPDFRSAINKIRLLTLTAQEFVECQALRSWLSESEYYPVLMNIVSNSCGKPMPSGFSKCTRRRYRMIDVGSTSNDDDARSEATFRYTVHDFRNMKGRITSPSCHVRNLPWSMRLAINNDQTESGNQNSISFFLLCKGNKSPSWSCKVYAELRVISTNLDFQPHTMTIDQSFSGKEFCWGYPKYMTLDPDFERKGYIKDGVVTFEVYVRAEEPKDISLDWDGDS